MATLPSRAYTAGCPAKRYATVVSMTSCSFRVTRWGAGRSRWSDEGVDLTRSRGGAEKDAEKKEKSQRRRGRGGSGVKGGFARYTFGLPKGSFRERCGGPGYRVFCVGIPAASDLVGIYEDVGAVLITLSTSIVHSFRLSTSVSRGSAIGAIRTSPGIIRSNGRSSRRSPPLRGTTVKLFGAYGKSVPPDTQRLLASKKTVVAARVVRATFSN